jgi:hypothetical protein
MMSSAQLASTPMLQEPAAGRTAPRPRGRPSVASGHQADVQALVRPGAVNGEATAELRADRSPGPARFTAVALWLRRALADSARAWALAAGVPPDLYN